MDSRAQKAGGCRLLRGWQECPCFRTSPAGTAAGCCVALLPGGRGCRPLRCAGLGHEADVLAQGFGDELGRVADHEQALDHRGFLFVGNHGEIEDGDLAPAHREMMAVLQVLAAVR